MSRHLRRFVGRSARKVGLLTPALFCSQFGQDRLVGDVLFRNKPGFFVDVGARDGRVISNTYYLEQIGWLGIAVEPHPSLFEELKRSRNCKTVNAAISDRQGELEFVKMLEEPYGHSGLLSTFRDTTWLENKKHEIIPVPTVTLEQVLTGISRIDYLDIDVEGHELEVLRGLDLFNHSIGVVGVETNPSERLKTKAIDRHMAESGYFPFIQLHADRFYAAEIPVLQAPTRNDFYTFNDDQLN